MTKRSVLIYLVDDDESVRRALSRLLRSEGFAVESFDSAPAFLGRSSVSGQACLVLDIRMPGMSGIELVDQMIQSGNELPTVLISAHGYEEVELGNRPSVLACLQKPINDEELLGLIEQV